MKSKFSACILESVWPRWVVFSVVILAIISSCSLLYLLKCHFWQKSPGEIVDIEEKETVVDEVLSLKLYDYYISHKQHFLELVYSVV